MLPEGTGELVISTKAQLPILSLQVPECLDFGFAPTKEISTLKSQISNTGEMDVEYSWQVNGPFKIIPERGKIRAGDVQLLIVNFEPNEASVFSAATVCALQSGQKFPMKITGIGKYPFLNALQNTLDFGSVFIGNTEVDELVLQNKSLVRKISTVKVLNFGFG